jgi:hypothetical protein
MEHENGTPDEKVHFEKAEFLSIKRATIFERQLSLGF